VAKYTPTDAQIDAAWMAFKKNLFGHGGRVATVAALTAAAEVADRQAAIREVEQSLVDMGAVPAAAELGHDQALYNEIVREADALRVEVERLADDLRVEVERLRNECDYLMAQMAGQRKSERERCAQVAEGWSSIDGDGDAIAAAIRTLGDET